MSETKDNKLIIITGPTGIGKTELTYIIRAELGCQIVSADSRQVYKELLIGTARPDDDEIQQHRIRCCGHVSIHEPYDAALYVNDAESALREDLTAHGYGLVSGGTGMYIKALTEGMDSFPEVPRDIVDKLNVTLDTGGLMELQAMLKAKDPDYYQKVDIHNPHRIIRALSVIEASGRTYSSFLGGTPAKNYKSCTIVLDMPKPELNERIDKRVLSMIDQGLVAEAESLFAERQLKALNTVGYKEIFDCLDGKCSLEEAIARIQIHTRQYAKRQITWQRKYNKGNRHHPSALKPIMKEIEQFLSSE